MNLKDFFWLAGSYGNDKTTPYSQEWIDGVGLSDIEKVRRNIVQQQAGAVLYQQIMDCFGQPNNKHLNMLKAAVVAYERANNYILPHKLITEILNPMGFVNWTGDLENWIEDGNIPSNFNAEAYSNIIYPMCPDLGELTEISTYDARHQLRVITGIHPYNLDNGDSVHRLFPEAMLSEVCAASPMIRTSYVKESNDCDDFADGTGGWLNYCGYGNVTFGEIQSGIVMTNGSKWLHRFNWALCDTGRLWLMEPQEPQSDGQFIYGSQCTFVNVDRIENIAWMRF